MTIRICRDSTSGVTDHYAQNDKHALHLAREIVARLNHEKKVDITNNRNVSEPVFSPEDLYGIVGANLKKSYDIREVSRLLICLVVCKVVPKLYEQ